MSIKKNIVSNYISQIYITLAGLISVPILIKEMGIDAYGLVGFYIALQGIFQLLDIGLSTTISRQATNYKHSIDQKLFLRIKKYAEKFFIGVGLCGIILFFYSSNYIANSWLKESNFPSYVINDVIKIMGVIIVIRWTSFLYRGIITGFEEQVWLSKINIIITTLKYYIVIPLIIYLDNHIYFYFKYQLIISVLEIVILIVYSKLLIKNYYSNSSNETLTSIKPLLKFALGIASTSTIWILVTQLDKIYLSKIISLKDYGEYSAIFLLASGVTLINNPISLALIPRLTAIASEKNYQKLNEEYKKYTRLICLATAPLAFILIIFSKQIIWVWTGNEELSDSSYKLLIVYSAANYIVNIGGMAYYLQYAKGNVKFHVIGNIISTIIYMPIMLIATNKYGAIGAASSWFIINILYLLFWVPMVHSKLDFIGNKLWFVNDVLKASFYSAIPLILCYLLDAAFSMSLNRFESFVKLAIYISLGYLVPIIYYIKFKKMSLI